MKEKLRKVTIREFKNIVFDKKFLKQIKKNKEPILRVVKPEPQKKKPTDPLIELEVALRRCIRVGFFKR